ncbi:MAG: DegQ family serine endoprotease [Gammaproteobacteria bacterium]|nr:MAG: DegQ family serine endoprotease [Gammaproteobacteria bacterium]
MNEQRSKSVVRRVNRKRTLFATTAVAAAVIAALNFGIPAQNANAALAPVDESIAPGSVQIAPPSFAKLIEAVQPAVVSIASDRPMDRRMPRHEGSPFQKFFEEQLKRQSPESMPNARIQAVGSGFIVDPDGYIVTNNHVIKDAEEITVILQDGTRYSAKVKGRDPKTDLALLKIEAPEELAYVRFGDSDKARVGDWVIAVGNPFGLGGSVSAGIISARGRDIQSGPYDDYLQIDAPINRGNSGGPLFDASGKVIGVNTAIFSPSGGNVGIGFAIPAALAEPVIAELKSEGRVARGWLGVQIQSIDEALAKTLDLEKQDGALVASVQPESPAERAGFKIGDVILAFGDQQVADARDLPRIVANTDKGDNVTVTVWRDGERKSLEVTLGSLPGEQTVAMAGSEEVAGDTPKLGVTLSALSTEAKQHFNLSDDEVGVLIVDVMRNSPAAKIGLQRGDIISRVGQTKVTKPEEVVSEIKRAARGKDKTVLLLIKRDGINRFVAVPLEQA